MASLQHDRPTCPRCQTQTAIPFAFPERGSRLICGMCGHLWEESDATVLERAYAAETEWARHEPEALKKRDKVKPRPNRQIEWSEPPISPETQERLYAALNARYPGRVRRVVEVCPVNITLTIDNEADALGAIQKVLETVPA